MKIEKVSKESFAVIGKEGSTRDGALAGAVYDYSCPETGKDYMFFPIRKR